MAKSISNVIKHTHTIKAKGFLLVNDKKELMIDTEDYGTISVVDLLTEMEGKFVELSVTEKSEDVVEYQE